jgi:regulator of protease activity HflC (stomatin/prohibitin superfamily)
LFNKLQRGIKMKKLLLVSSIALLTACSNVPPGYVGVLVNKVGGDKGVDQKELTPGRYWLTINEELFTFPTFSQTQIWTKDKNEGSPNDDSMSFQTSEGITANSDIGITYHIDESKVSTVFQKYRQGIEEITHTYLRSMVRDGLNTEAARFTTESINGAGKTELMNAVKNRVISETKDIGIVIENVYWIGSIRWPEEIVNSINMKVQSIQKTQQRENEVAQSRAEAEKAIAEARGVAESRLVIARAEAEAIELRGKALRANPEIIRLNEVERWDGKLPTTMIPNASIPVIGK